MTDRDVTMPERIWVYSDIGQDGIKGGWMRYEARGLFGPMPEYVRADLHEAAIARIAELEGGAA